MHQKQKVTMDIESKLKRKFDTYYRGDQDTVLATDLVDEIVLRHFAILNTSSSNSEADYATAKEAAHALSKLVKDKKNIDRIVEYGAVPALVKHLQTRSSFSKDDSIQRTYKCEIQIECMAALKLIATKSGYKKLIVDTGIISHLVNFLKRRELCCEDKVVYGIIRGAVDLIRILAHGKFSIQSHVRINGGIPPLVELLEFADPKVQRAAAWALLALVLRNDDNRNQIVALDALPSIILLLQSDDPSTLYAAIYLIVLVYSSPNLKKEVLQAGALQPVIRLLSSSCSGTQKTAAMLIDQFALDCKTHLAKRGAIPPLIKMLYSPDDQLKKQAALTLGHLAHQDSDNQAGIGCNGGIEPLLNLFGTKTERLQYYAAFALSALSDNKDNIVEFVRAGGVEKLAGSIQKLQGQGTAYYVGKTLESLEEKIHGRVLKQLLCVMRTAEKFVQKRVALALAHLCDFEDIKLIFVDNNGLELLLELLNSTDLKQQQSGLIALSKLTNGFNILNFKETALPSPAQHLYLGQKFLNDPILSDVTFIIEGEPLYAHKICLVASSDAFRAMFFGGYKERDAQEIVITNIRRDVFEVMMRFIYTGSVGVNSDIAQDLLRAADQYLLEGLKRLCEHKIAQDISTENIQLLYELADASNAMKLRRSCASFVLQHCHELITKPWFSEFVKDIIPEVRSYATNLLESY